VRGYVFEYLGCWRTFASLSVPLSNVLEQMCLYQYKKRSNPTHLRDMLNVLNRWKQIGLRGVCFFSQK